jgi:genome maintenance exonuclease 1
MKIELPKLQRVTKENGERYYVTPEGNKYPSVTTVLSEYKKKELAKWRKRVGNEEADRIKNFAAKRGTTFHTLCENFLTNKPYQDNIGGMFDKFIPILKRIKNIKCLEQHLYSDELKVAGQVDCIAEFDSCISVIDFKTSSKLKSEKYIWDYFMQASAYSYMFEDRTGIPVQDVTILISCESGENQIFYAHRDEWIEGFRKFRNLYNKDVTKENLY